MNDAHSVYESPLSTRYASQEMSLLFSARFKHLTWRRLWLALAKAQKELGLPISEQQIRELESHLDTFHWEKIAALEKEFRHDVMAHIHAYGELCPAAKPIIHWGATSCYVTDNTELIQMREGFEILKGKLILVIRQLSHFAAEHAALPCLSFTHFQAAQPTTVGKRACLWVQDFLSDLHDLNERLNSLRFLGVKGATGTQASFLALFDQDAGKVKQLEELVAKEMGFYRIYSISGQTYPRKQDMRLFSVLTGLAASSHKFATDIRLLAHLKELEEPFSHTQVGSSAMPYKRNPMSCERVCGLSRFLISLAENPAYTASTQWLERTLDDSANRRLALPEAFLCADGILNLLIEVTSQIVLYPKIILKHLEEEMPFLATENILMEAVKKGKDRQLLHEALRKHSLEASRKIKEEGLPGDLLARISRDAAFGLSEKELSRIVKVEHFIGRSEAQVREFLAEEVEPFLNHFKHIKPPISSLKV